MLSNTYHLYLRPGHERIERLGGLHRFMGWDGPILTDSGGFQVVSLAASRTIDDDGATFRSHIDGSQHHLTPEKAIAIQEALGADMAVAFDHPVYPSSERAVVEDATERTHRWAERSIAAHERGNRREDQALFGVIQGGLEPDLRERSTLFIAGLPFDGINIGGLAGDETPAQRRAALDVVLPLLADDPRPRYLMGLGSPADLLDAVDQGIDLFDSVLPSRVARTARCGCRATASTFATRRSSTTRSRSRTAARASRAGTSRGPTGPLVPGEGAPRVPARNLSQPDLHPRLHAQDPHRTGGRKPPQIARRAAPACGPEHPRRSAG